MPPMKPSLPRKGGGGAFKRGAPLRPGGPRKGAGGTFTPISRAPIRGRKIGGAPRRAK